jgi:hypothetical protein
MRVYSYRSFKLKQGGEQMGASVENIANRETLQGRAREPEWNYPRIMSSSNPASIF